MSYKNLNPFSKIKNKNLRYGMYFLLGVMVLYLFLFFFNKELFFVSLESSLKIFKQIYWVLIIVLLLMALFNYFLNRKFILKYLGKSSGIKGWFFAIVFGILSMGPIYVWYPLLSDLMKKGMRTALVAGFIYNRAIKIPLLPLLVGYFGIGFVIVLTIVMIFASVIQGLIIEKLVPVSEILKIDTEKNKSNKVNLTK